MNILKFFKWVKSLKYRKPWKSKKYLKFIKILKIVTWKSFNNHKNHEKLKISNLFKCKKSFKFQHLISHKYIKSCYAIMIKKKISEKSTTFKKKTRQSYQ